MESIAAENPSFTINNLNFSYTIFTHLPYFFFSRIQLFSWHMTLFVYFSVLMMTPLSRLIWNKDVSKFVTSFISVVFLVNSFLFVAKFNNPRDQLISCRLKYLISQTTIKSFKVSSEMKLCSCFYCVSLLSTVFSLIYHH